MIINAVLSSQKSSKHYSDVMMDAMACQITSLAIVYSTVYLVADQRKHQSSASLAFVRGIHRSPVNSPHKGQVMRKRFPFDDVIMDCQFATFDLWVRTQQRPANSHWFEELRNITIDVNLLHSVHHKCLPWNALMITYTYQVNKQK